MSQSITPDAVAYIAEKLREVGLSEAAIDVLRESHPGVRITHCSDDDVVPHAKPVAQGEGFNLYLVGGDQHCLSLTNDFDSAIGVVCAEVFEDD